MSDLRQEISRNIQLVFDNEQSFIDEFAESNQIGMVYSFYMGSDYHKCVFEYCNGGTIDRSINADKFDLWKSKINNNEQTNNE